MKICPRYGSTNISYSGYTTSVHDCCNECNLGKISREGGVSDDHFTSTFPEIDETDVKSFQEHLRSEKK